MEFDVNIEGLEETRRKLLQLGPEMRNRALKNAVGQGASIIRKDATSRAPKRTGAMAKNIRVQYASRTSRETGDVMFRVGVRGGAQAKGAEVKFSGSKRGRRRRVADGSSTYYWRFIHFGLKTRKLKGTPFLTDAANAKAAQVISEVGKRVEAGVARYVRQGKTT